MLASAEYYQLGLSHPIMQTYYNILVSVAKMMGADDKIAKKDMKDLLEFEIELAKVVLLFDGTGKCKTYIWWIFAASYKTFLYSF